MPRKKQSYSLNGSPQKKRIAARRTGSQQPSPALRAAVVLTDMQRILSSASSPATALQEAVGALKRMLNARSLLLLLDSGVEQHDPIPMQVLGTDHEAVSPPPDSIWDEFDAIDPQLDSSCSGNLYTDGATPHLECAYRALATMMNRDKPLLASYNQGARAELYRRYSDLQRRQALEVVPDAGAFVEDGQECAEESRGDVIYTRLDRRWSEALSQEGYGASIGVPLASQRPAHAPDDRFEWSGVLVAFWELPREFDEDELALIRMVASLLVLYLDGALLHEYARTHMERARVIEEIARELSAELQNYQRILSLILTRVMGLTRADAGAIARYDAASGNVYVMEAQGYDPAILARYQEQPWDLHTGLLGRAVREKTLLLAPDVRHVPEYVSGSEGLHSELTVPLIHEGRVLAVLVLESRQINAFSYSDAQFVYQVVEHAVIAVQNAQLYADADRRARQLAALQEVAKNIGEQVGQAGLSETYRHLLDTLAGLMHVRMSAVLLVDWEQQALVCQYPAYGLSREQADAYQIPLGTNARVLRNLEGERPYVSNDLAGSLLVDEFGLRGLIDELQVNKVMVAGLKVGSRLIGALAATDKQDGQNFSEDDVRLMSLFAAQAAIAIQKARLYEREREQAHRTATLLRLNQAISASFDFKTVLRSISQELFQILDAGGVFFIRMRADGYEFIEDTVLGLNRDEVESVETMIPFIVKSDLVQQAIKARQPFIVENTVGKPDQADWIRFLVTNSFADLHSLIVMPVGTAASLTGILVLFWRGASRIFSQAERDLLEAIPSQISIAVENARLYSESRQRIHELTGLSELAQEVGQFVHISDVYSQLVGTIGRLMHVRRAVLLLYEEETYELVGRNPAFGMPAATIERYRARLEPGSLGWDLWQSGLSYFTANDAGNDYLVASLGMSEMVREAGIQKMAMVILKVGNRQLGMLQASDKISGDDFDEDDVRLLNIFASQAAVLVQNARLFEQTDQNLARRIGELNRLQQISQRLNSTLDLQEIVQLIAQESVEATPAHTSSVYLGTGMNPPDAIARYGAMAGYSEASYEQAWARARLLPPDSPGYLLMCSDVPYVLNDITSSSSPSPVAAVRAVLGVPIRSGDHMLGRILLRSQQPNVFDQDVIRFVEALANAAALAIANARNYRTQVDQAEQLSRRTEQLGALLATSNQLKTNTHLEATLDIVVQAIVKHSNFSVAALNLLEPDSAQLTCVAVAGVAPESIAIIKHTANPLSAFQTMMQERFRMSQSYYVDHTRRPENEDLHPFVVMPDKSLKPLPEMAIDEQSDTGDTAWHPADMLLVPLQGTDGQLAGILSVDSPKDGKQPNRETVEVLELFANQAAIAIENAGLFQATRDYAEQQRALIEIGRALSQELDRRQLFRLIYEQVKHIMPVDVFLGAATNIETDDPEILVAIDSGIDYSATTPAHGGYLRHVLDTRQPLLIAGAEDRPLVQSEPMGGSRPSASLMFVPVLLGDRALGILSVQSYRAKAYHRQNLDMLAAIANQAAIALENARLFAERERRINSLSLLNQIGQTISASLTTADLLSAATQQRLYEMVAGLFGTRHFSLALYDRDADTLTFPFVVVDGEVRALPARSGGDGLYDHVLHTRKTLQLYGHNLRAQIESLGIKEREIPLISWLGVPLIAGDQVIGVVAIQDFVQYHENAADLLATIARQLAVALEKARLLEVSEQSAKEMRILQETAFAVSSGNDLNEVVKALLQGARSILDADQGYLYLLDEAGERFERFGVRQDGSFSRTYDTRSRPQQGHQTWSIMTERRIHIVEDAYTNPTIDPRFVKPERRANLGLPVVIGNHALGVLYVTDSRPHRFDDHKVRLVNTLVNQAVASIERVRLFEAAGRNAEEMRLLQEVAFAVSSSTGLDDVVRTFLDGMKRILGTPLSVLYLPDEQGEQYEQFMLNAGNGYLRSQQRRDEASIAQQVVERGEPLVVRDVVEAAEDGMNLNSIPGNWRAFVSVPVRVGAGITGVMAGLSLEPRSFNQRQVALLTTLADQAATAIERVRLAHRQTEQAHALRKHTAQLTGILDVLSTFQTDQSEDELLQRVADTIRDALDFRTVHIRLLNQQTQMMESHAFSGMPEDAIDHFRSHPTPLSTYTTSMLLDRYRIGRSYLMLHEQQYGQVGDITWEWMPVLDDRAPGEWHPDDALIVPLTDRSGAVMGVIYVDDPSDRQIPGRDTIDVLDIFAQLSSAALLNVRLYREAQQNAVDRSELYEVGMQISRSVEVPDTLTTICEAAQRLTDADVVTFYMRDEATGQVYGHYIIPPSGEAVRTSLRKGGMTRQIIDSGEAVLVKDTATHPGVNPSVIERGIRSLIGVPVRYENRTLGVLYVNNLKPVPFTERHVEVLRFMMTQAALAINNARLFEQTRRQARQMSVLFQIAQATSTTLDMNELARLVVQEVLRGFGYSHAGLSLVRDTHLDIIYQVGYEQVTDRWSTGKGVIGRVARTGEAAFIKDSHADPDFVVEPGLEHLTELIAVPIMLESRVLGVLSVESDATRHLDENDFEAVRSVASQVALAINNARLYERERERSAETQRLYELGVSLNRNLDLGELLRSAAKGVSDLFRADACAISVFESFDGSGDVMLHCSYPHTQAAGEPPVAKRSLSRDPLSPDQLLKRSGQPLRVNDVAQAIGQGELVLDSANERTGAFLSVPLTVNEAYAGSVTVSYAQPHRFTQHDSDILNLAANQIATVLQNAHLYADTRRHAAETDLLYQLSSGFATTLDMVAIVRLVADGARRLARTSNSSLYLLRDDGSYTGWMLENDRGRDMVPADISGKSLRLAKHIVQNGMPVVLPDTRNPGDLPVPEPGLETRERLALIGIPVARENRVMGVLFVSNSEVTHFSNHTVALLQILASQAAGALDNARLYDEARRSVQETALLNEIGTQLGRSLELNTILQTVADGARRLAGADYGTLVLLPHSRRPVIQISPEQPLPESITPDLVINAERDPILGWGNAGTYAESESLHAALQAALGFHSAVAVPVSIEPDVRSALYVMRHDNLPFGERIPTLLSILATQAAAAIRNADLYDRAVRQADEMAVLYDLGKQLASSLDLEELLATIARGARTLVHGATGSVFVVDDAARVRIGVSSDSAAEHSLQGMIGQAMMEPGNLLDRVRCAGDQVLVADYQAIAAELPPLSQHVLETDRIRSGVAIPLYGKDATLIGGIAVTGRESEQFDEHDITLLRFLATQAVAAVSNAQLYADARKSVEEMRLLNELGNELSRTLDLDTIAETVVKGAARLLNGYGGVLYLPSESNIPLYRYGSPERGILEVTPKVLQELRTEPSQIWQIADTGEPLIVEDYSKAIVGPKNRKMIDDGGVKSSVGVPLRIDGTSIGSLVVTSTALKRFSQRDMTLLQILAIQAGTALRNARQYAETVRNAQEMTDLYNIGLMLGSSLDIEELLQQVAEGIRHLMRSTVATILVQNESEDGYYWKTDAENPQEYPDVVQAGLSANHSMIAALEHQPVIAIDDVQQTEAYRQQPDQFDLFKMRAIAGVPLISEGKRVGAIFIADHLPHSFSQHELDLLTILANQVSATVVNARLFRQTRRNADEMGLLYDATNRMNSTLDMNAVLQVVVKTAALIGKAESCSVYLPVADGDALVAEATATEGLTVPGGIRRLVEGGAAHVIHSMVLKTGDPIVIADTAQTAPSLAAAGVRAIVALPVRSGDRMLGVVYITGSKPATYTESEMRLFEILAGQAGAAIENAQLYRQAQRNAEEMGVLYSEVQALATQLEQRVHERTAALEKEKDRIQVLYTISTELSAGP